MSAGESKSLDYNVRIRDAPSAATATRLSAFPRLQVKHIFVSFKQRNHRAVSYGKTLYHVSAMKVFLELLRHRSSHFLMKLATKDALDTILASNCSC